MAATAADWKNEPFGAVAPIPYAARFSAEEMEQLKLGLIPEQMDDKWFVYFDYLQLSFHRSWTGQAIYRVRFRQDIDGFVVDDAVIAQDVLARSDADFEARLLDFLVGALLLGQDRDFPRPADIKDAAPGLYQHHVVGRGYPETPVSRAGAKPDSLDPKKPWWQLWR